MTGTRTSNDSVEAMKESGEMGDLFMDGNGCDPDGCQTGLEQGNDIVGEGVVSIDEKYAVLESSRHDEKKQGRMGNDCEVLCYHCKIKG